MATTYSTYLRLRIDSGLTANAKVNLNIIDSLGALIQSDLTGSLQLRSRSNIVIEPNSAESEGSGEGGTVTVGTPTHEVDSFTVHAGTVSFSAALGMLDAATSGTKYLNLRYKSDLSGSVDTASNRTLSMDLNGADRNLILGGDLSVLGNSLSLTAPVATNWTLPATAGSAGQILSTDGAGNLSWINPGAGAVVSNTYTWISGAVHTLTHNLGTEDVDVTVRDENGDLIYVDIDVISANAITLTSSEAPSGTWTVTIQSGA